VESFGLTVGGLGSGTVNIGDHGKLTTTGDATVGEKVTANIQTVSVTSAGAWTVGGDLSLGEAAIAIATVTSGGSIQVDSNLTMGGTPAATGLFTLSGVLSAGSSRTAATLKWGGVLDVGEAGTGTLTISGGGQATALAGKQGLVEIGSAKGANGGITISGAGSELTGQSLAVGGILTSAGGLGSLSVGSGAAAHFALGGVIWAGGQIRVPSGTLTLGTTVDDGVLSTTGGSIRVSGGFTGTGAVGIGAGGVFVLDASKTTTANRVLLDVTSGGKFSLTGGSGNDLFRMSAAALTSQDVVSGGAGTDTLQFTTAGSIGAAAFANVFGIDIIRLAAGVNALTLNNTMMTSSDANHLTIFGGVGVNTINASAVSTGLLVYSGLTTTQTIFIAGNGEVALTGGVGADVFEFKAASLTAQDAIVGGLGHDTLDFTTAGAIGASAFTLVSGIDQIDLADGTNSLTLSNAVVQHSDADTLTIDGGAGADTINAASVGSGSTLIFDGGGGADHITGGMGDNVYRVDKTPGSLTITNSFAAGTAAHGLLQYGAGLSDQSLWFEQSGSNLVVDVIGTTEQATLNGWFGANKSAEVAEIQAGGLELDSGVAKLVSAMAAFSAANPGFNPTAASVTMPPNTTLQSAIAAAWHH
jgi:hypothetical protein